MNPSLVLSKLHLSPCRVLVVLWYKREIKFEMCKVACCIKHTFCLNGDWSSLIFGNNI